MAKVHVDDDTLRVIIHGYGVAEDGHPVEVPDAVADQLQKGNRRKLLRIERDAPPDAPPPMSFLKKKVKED